MGRQHAPRGTLGQVFALHSDPAPRHSPPRSWQSASVVTMQTETAPLFATQHAPVSTGAHNRGVHTELSPKYWPPVDASHSTRVVMVQKRPAKPSMQHAPRGVLWQLAALRGRRAAISRARRARTLEGSPLILARIARQDDALRYDIAENAARASHGR
jgi:hypothetical protein